MPKLDSTVTAGCAGKFDSTLRLRPFSRTCQSHNEGGSVTLVLFISSPRNRYCDKNLRRENVGAATAIRAVEGFLGRQVG